MVKCAEFGMFVMKIGPCPFAKGSVAAAFFAVMLGEADFYVATFREVLRPGKVFEVEPVKFVEFVP